AEAGRGRDEHEDPGERPVGDEVPVAEGQDRGRREVERRPEALRDRTDLVTDAVEHEPVPEDERAEPGREQADRDRRPEEPVEPVTRPGRSAPADRPDDPPRPADDVATEAERARCRA